MNGFANPNGKKSQRTIALELRDPRSSFESNTATWQTFNQSVALGIDWLNNSKDWRAKTWARAGLFVGGLWSNAMLRFYSHEVAHEYVYRSNNIRIHNALDFRSWKNSYIPALYYPSWKQSTVDPNLLNEDELISATVAGLNQDELNAETAWQSSFERESISFYDAQSYLLTKLRDVEYIAKSGSDEAPFAAGQKIHQLQYDVYAVTPHLFDDVNLYRLALLNNNVDISNQQLMNRALFADMMSWFTWESVWSLFSYLKSGENSSRLFSFQLAENVQLVPPLFSHYMTTSGSFFNSSYVLLVNDKKYQIDIGSMIGFTRIEAFRHYRFGLKALDIELQRFWHISPYVYANGRSGLNIDGYSVGFINIVPFSQNLAATVKFEYNKNDIVKNLVKRERKGLQTVFGVRIEF